MTTTMTTGPEIPHCLATKVTLPPRDVDTSCVLVFDPVTGVWEAFWDARETPELRIPGLTRDVLGGPVLYAEAGSPGV